MTIDKSQRLGARIRPDYVRPVCESCGKTLVFTHINPEGSRYACLACEFDWDYASGGEAYPMTNHEASWIIRNTTGNEVQS